MEYNLNKTAVEIIKGGAFGGTHFRTFIQVLMENGTEIHGKNSMSQKILSKNILQIIMMLNWINTKSKLEHN